MKSSMLQLGIALALSLLASSTTLAADNARPFLQQPLVPVSAAPGGFAFTLTVRGAGFVTGSVLDWNGQPLSTSFVSAIELTAQVPAANIAQAGTASVTVVNPAPGGGESNVVFFSVATARSRSFSYQSPVQYEVGLGPAEIAEGDFNGDGFQDLAVAVAPNAAQGTLQILLGNGDGTFQPPVQYRAAAGVTCVAAGDMNGDGKLDLVTGGQIGQVGVLLGNGDGTFQAPIVTPNLSGGTNDVVLADFNRDGNLDAAFAGNGGVWVLFGAGNGTFNKAFAEYQTNGQPVAVTTGDFNGDDILDLAVANLGGNTFSILLGKGEGRFTQPVSRSAGGSGSFTDAIATADLNGDGILDLAVGNALSTSGVAVLLGNGDGTFGPLTVYGSSTYGIALGDLNDDGNVDLALAENGNDGSLFGNGDGTFGLDGTFGTGFQNLHLAIADFNGDGRLDLVFSNFEKRTIDVLLQTAQ
jgi:hypothetical protein